MNFLSRTNSLGIVILLGFSLAIRIIFFHMFLRDNPCRLMYDAAHYHKAAISLVEGKGFTVDQQSYFYRLPGYPAFLAGCYAFGGRSSTALGVQILLAALIPLLIFLLARAMFPYQQAVAWLAAIIAAVHPGLLIFSGLVMSETLFVALFIIFLWMLFKGRQQPQSLWVYFFTGIILGLATLVRPVGHYILLVLPCVFLCGDRLRLVTIQNIITLVGGWAMVVIPWLIRNFLLTGYVFLHTLNGPHMINHAAIPLVMQSRGLSWQEARQEVYGLLKKSVDLFQQEHGRKIIEIEEASLAESLAYRYAIQCPWQTLKHAGKNMVKTMFSLYSSELLVIDSVGLLPSYADSRSYKQILERFLKPHVQNKAIVSVIYGEIALALFLLLGLIGFFIGAVRQRKNVWAGIVGTLFIVMFIGLSAVCGFARLRLPCEPLIIIFASYFWVTLAQWYHRW